MTLEQDPPRERPESDVTESDPMSGLDAGLGIPLPNSMPANQLIGAMEPSDPAAAEPPAKAPIEEPAAPPTPEALALDNARGGRWAMNDYFDGLVWLGADGRPVMRRDGSPVGFFFRDAPRLVWRLGREEGAEPNPRRALAPLDAGFNDDWDPQVQKSYFATMTKMTRLLAYDYVRTTEPEEAVRKAVADIFGNPSSDWCVTRGNWQLGCVGKSVGRFPYAYRPRCPAERLRFRFRAHQNERDYGANRYRWR